MLKDYIDSLELFIDIYKKKKRSDCYAIKDNRQVVFYCICIFFTSYLIFLTLLLVMKE